ncbi:hypothetical protein L3X38_041736 [Prunus dulcis]|uniref:Zinc knuckle CX2CX4HX4C domain-containing protein n=1 Tax=Prunus dulcis TaxID=3755 RepID=A0AAD4YL68_PRUDU|nr:hypothetical protein L3X38_041736 [Prunus dulcis]
MASVDDLVDGISSTLTISDAEAIEIVGVEELSNLKAERFLEDFTVVALEDPTKFLFSFKSDFDRKKMMRRSPWTYDPSLLLLKGYGWKGRSYRLEWRLLGKFLAYTGWFEDFSATETVYYVKVVCRKEPAKQYEIEYEQLPFFCLFCGNIDHVDSNCELKKSGAISIEQYGRWKTIMHEVFSIRAENSLKGKRYGLLGSRVLGWFW